MAHDVTSVARAAPVSSLSGLPEVFAKRLKIPAPKSDLITRELLRNREQSGKPIFFEEPMLSFKGIAAFLS
jgi:hypothetical protein